MKRAAWIIVNHNGGEEVLRTVRSIHSDLTEADQIVLVDNGSSDSSAELAWEAEPNLHLILNGRNMTFAEANNRGIQWALDEGFEYIGIMNPDVRVKRGMTNRLISDLCESEDGEACASSPVILFENPKDTIWYAGGYIFWLFAWAGHTGIGSSARQAAKFKGETSYLTGCCWLTESKVWRLVGPFDPRYGMYAEDLDWSHRARRKGVHLRVCPDAILVHRISQSSGGGRSPFKMWYRSQAGRLFFQRWTRNQTRIPQILLRHLPVLAYALMLSLKREWPALESYLKGQWSSIEDPISWPPEK
jgi:GT2 family glycosyltransferase